MASIFGHAAVAFTLKKCIKTRDVKYLLFFCILSSIVPDFDFIWHKMGVPYSSMWGHRGITHSIPFAIVWSLIITYFLKPERVKTVFILIFLSTISHSLLDAMTTGGKGVAFFAPFSGERYFFPFRPIKVSPIGITRFFSSWGLKVLINELVWIMVPCILVLLPLYYKEGKSEKD